MRDSNKRSGRAVVAMSGGVDSSAVAGMLKQQGYEVIGITLRLNTSDSFAQTKSCCAGVDIVDAQNVAEHLQIPHYVLDYRDIFKDDVINPFINDYAHGSTPIPCVECNRSIKFKHLLNFTKDLEAEILATGHYITTRRIDNGAHKRWGMYRGQDPKKDQSYFLYMLNQEQLNMLRFPIGGLCKKDTRQFAAELGLPVAEKRESQNLCFVTQGHYTDLIKKLDPQSVRPGKIRDLSGKILGEHNGVIHYTVGQRKGLKICGDMPYYVVKLVPSADEVIVGPRSALMIKEIVLMNFNWIDYLERQPYYSPLVYVKVRSTQDPVPASLRINPHNQDARVTFHVEEYGVSTGQACVIYEDHTDHSQVLGGGTISKTLTTDKGYTYAD